LILLIGLTGSLAVHSGFSLCHRLILLNLASLRMRRAVTAAAMVIMTVVPGSLALAGLASLVLPLGAGGLLVYIHDVIFPFTYMLFNNFSLTRPAPPTYA
jgi:hypothetical protein